MKRIILTLLIVALAVPAFAEVNPILSTDSDTATVETRIRFEFITINGDASYQIHLDADKYVGDVFVGKQDIPAKSASGEEAEADLAAIYALAKQLEAGGTSADTALIDAVRLIADTHGKQQLGL